MTKSFAQDIKDFLSKIPLSEKESLKSVFYNIMELEHGYFTLFGDKPVTLAGDYTVTPYSNILYAHENSGGIFWKNWEIWQKYQANFLLNDYLFIEEPSPKIQSLTNLIFINKKAFVIQVNKNLDLFKQKLQRDLTGQSLLNEIESKQKFASVINNDETLWGLLLGYGLQNAELYCYRAELEKFINYQTLPSKPIRKPNPSYGFNSIEEECEFLYSILKPVGEYNYTPIAIGDIHFVADLISLETTSLLKKYQKQRSKISAIYAKGDFLEITFTKLLSNSAS